jgi:hypothetical protein
MKSRLVVLFAVLTAFVSMASSAEASSAKSNLWGTIGTNCAGAYVRRGDLPSYGQYGSAVYSARTAGTVSISTGLEAGYNAITATLGVTFTPSPECKKEYPLNVWSLASHTDKFKWNGTSGQWDLCSPSEFDWGSPYGPYWSVNNNIDYQMSHGGLLCGPGWYYVEQYPWAYQSGWKMAAGGEFNKMWADQSPYYGYSN